MPRRPRRNPSDPFPTFPFRPIPTSFSGPTFCTGCERKPRSPVAVRRLSGSAASGRPRSQLPIVIMLLTYQGNHRLPFTTPTKSDERHRRPRSFGYMRALDPTSRRHTERSPIDCNFLDEMIRNPTPSSWYMPGYTTKRMDPGSW
jgi:hypothetical protein